MDLNTEALIDDKNLTTGLLPKLGESAPAFEQQIVEAVQEMYRNTCGEKCDAKGEWDNYILERQKYYDIIKKGSSDEAAEILKNFWRNNLGAIVKEYATYSQLESKESDRLERFANGVCRNYRIWREIYNQPTEVLKTPSIGNPWGYMIDGVMIAPKACRHHAGATNLLKLGRKNRRNVFCEIGGGFGGMASYLLDKIQNGIYINVDLPESLVISAYYLSCAFPNKKVRLPGRGEDNFSRITKEYDIVFLLPEEYAKLPDNSVHILFNTFSFSEIPFQALEQYFKVSDRVVTEYIWHNNMDRSGVINRGFERIPASKYPISNKWTQLFKHFDLFHGLDGDYVECLYRKDF